MKNEKLKPLKTQTLSALQLIAALKNLTEESTAMTKEARKMSEETDKMSKEMKTADKS